MERFFRMKKVRRKEEGAAIIEAGLSLPVYLLIILGIMWLSYTVYCMHALNYVVNDTARWLLLGHRMKDPNDPNLLLSREESAKEVAVKTGRRYYISIDRDQISVCPLEVPNCGNAEYAGDREGTFIIRISKNISLLRAFPSVFITRSATGRNEPFLEVG